MRKGENIFKRKDGRWEARYIKGYGPSGKVAYGFCYGKTYREAKEKVTNCKLALASGKTVPQAATQRRFAFYCEEWLRQRENRVRESTFVKYTAVIDRHIKPKLGGYFPAEITGGMIDAWTKELLSVKKLAAKTVHDVLVILRGILSHAAAQCPGMIPETAIAYPKESRKEMRVLTREEQARFLAFLLTATDPCKFGVLVMLLSGIRIGELCALKWGNIDLKEQSIRIDATLQRLHDTGNRGQARSRIVVSAPKSVASVRTIPLTDHAVQIFRRMEVKNPDAYLLTGTETCMEPRTLQYRIEKYARACGLEGVHAHTFRHTFATRAVEVGFEIKSLSEILGHATTRITLERYVHSSMELKRRNMDKLQAAGL